MLSNKVVLITGGTGSFGHAFVEKVLREHTPKKIIIFSRDEYKQYCMAQKFPKSKYPIRYFLGDVRDTERLRRAFDGVDYIVHAAALKQVPALEYNPTEAVKTNVDGASNIVQAAIDMGVKKVVALSTDKAVHPANLYGATKLVAEKIFVAATAFGGRRVTFSAVRYGNVVGSRGSIIPLLLNMRKQGIRKFPITDERMTRFWITLEQAVDLVFFALANAEGNEIFVPRIPSMRIVDLARAIDPQCSFDHIGLRPGEKVHEFLVSENEGRHVRQKDNVYVVLPQFQESQTIHEKYSSWDSVADGFCYRSDVNDLWLNDEDMKRIVNEYSSSKQ